MKDNEAKEHKVKEKTSSDMVRGNLDLMILSTLADGSKYGYLIQESLTRASAGAFSVQAGTLYPLLHRLEADGLVTSRWDHSTGRKRKWYRLTPKGRKRLVQQAQQWREYADCIWRILGPVLGQSPDATGGTP